MLACPRCGSTYLRDVVHCGLDGERLIQTPTDLLLGRTIDRYAIEGVLGDGGMARVYRARHVHLAQPFALKVLFGDMATDRALAERFRREGQSAARIKHPNVVSVTDFGVSAEGLSFMAMELLEGPTLAEVVKGDKSLAPARVAAIVRQVSEGLGAAHALEFVHRDLKPKNVMVVKEGAGQRIKILDFGLVRPLDSPDARLTQQGQIFGTPAYMAPEQITEAPIDARTDLYALGAMLYELLSGKPPFTGQMAEIFRKHLYETPPPLPDRSGLGELALVLLSKERAARPRSAREVIEIIDGLGLGLETDGTLVSMPPALARRPESMTGASVPLAPPPPLGSGSASRAGSGAASRAGSGSGPRPPLDVTGASPAASAEISLDDSMGIAIADSREIDDRAIRKMAAGSRPSLLVPALFLVAAGAAGWFGFRHFAPPPAGATAADAGAFDDAGAIAAPVLTADAGAIAAARDAGAAAPKPSKPPRTPAERAAAGAAGSVVGGVSGGISGAIAGAVGGAVSGAGGDLEDILPPIPPRGAVVDDDLPDAAVAALPDAASAPVIGPVIADAGPSAARPDAAAPLEAPPRATPTGAFANLDRELRRALIERDLHLLDLESNAPDAVRRWRAWRMRPDGQEPEAEARDDVFATLREAAVIVALDPRTLLELKLARLDKRVDEQGSPALRTELDALVAAAAAATSARARSESLSQLLAFELKLDRTTGEE